MSILGRYVFRQSAGAVVLILLSLTGITWIAVALRQLELMTSQGQDAFRFLAMTTLAIPSLMAVIAPVALLIAALHVLNRLNGDSELIVMTAGGMPAWALLKPLGVLAVIVSLGVLVVNHAIGPWSQRLLRDLAVQVRTDLMTQVLQPWRFTTPERKLTVHIRDRGPSGELLGLLMHDARDSKQVVSYLAERGLIIKQGDTAYLRMEKGHILRRPENEAATQIVAFDQYVLDLNQLEQRADQTQLLRPRERYTAELLRPDPNDPVYKHNPGGFRSELHERLSSPLYPIAFVLVALAFTGQAQTTRQNRLRSVVAAFAVAVGCRVLGVAATNAAVTRPSAVALLYLVPISAMVVAGATTHLQMYPRPAPKMVRALGSLTERWKAAGAAMWANRGVMRGAQRARG